MGWYCASAVRLFPVGGTGPEGGTGEARDQPGGDSGARGGVRAEAITAGTDLAAWSVYAHMRGVSGAISGCTRFASSILWCEQY